MSSAVRCPAFLRFVADPRARVWGGRALAEELGRDLPEGDAWGESWEVFDRPEGGSVVLDGPWAGRELARLWRERRGEVFGDSLTALGGPFPLLIKWLDCRERLSLQVHPPASSAIDGAEPKTETWFIARAGADAEIFFGFERACTPAELAQACAGGEVEPLVQRLRPLTGEIYHLPSGRIHALGGDLLIAEVQQNSDTTYRLWDWGRVGLDGRPRELHLGPGIAAANLDDVRPAAVVGDEVEGDGYRLRLRTLEAGTALVAPQGECRLVGVIEGELGAGGARLQRGDWVLLTAAGGGGLVVASTGARCLEVEILAGTGRAGR